MSVSVPNLSLSNFSRLKGQTTGITTNGAPADHRTFTVSKPAEFNFKINNSFTNVDIIDTSTNKVVANLRSKQDATDVSARLGPGTYSAVISQANRTAGVRDYSLDVTEKQNVMMTAGGALMKGTAQPPENGDTGVQKHNIKVIQGGSFTANLTLPNSRWAMMSKEGKVVASSDLSKPDAQDFFTKPTYKIDPGDYQLIIIPPAKLKAATPFQFNFVPRDPTVQAAATASQESEVSKTLRERQVRLKQWAAEAKSTSTKA